MRDFKRWLRYWTYRSNWPYEIGKRKERAVMWLVWRLPSVIVEWCVVRAWSHATTGHYGDTDGTAITVFDTMQRWDTPIGGDRRRRHELYRKHRETSGAP